MALDRSAGGSSGGSAAAPPRGRRLPLGLGTGGSLRIPSPSLRHVHDQADAWPGPHARHRFSSARPSPGVARTVADCEPLLAAMSGSTRPRRPLRRVALWPRMGRLGPERRGFATRSQALSLSWTCRRPQGNSTWGLALDDLFLRRDAARTTAASTSRGEVTGSRRGDFLEHGERRAFSAEEYVDRPEPAGGADGELGRLVRREPDRRDRPNRPSRSSAGFAARDTTPPSTGLRGDLADPLLGLDRASRELRFHPVSAERSGLPVSVSLIGPLPAPTGTCWFTALRNRTSWECRRRDRRRPHPRHRRAHPRRGRADGPIRCRRSCGSFGEVLPPARACPRPPTSPPTTASATWRRSCSPSTTSRSGSRRPERGGGRGGGGHPDVLIPFASIDPAPGAGARQARRLVAEHGVRGFKFHPNLQAFFPNDRHAYPIYEAIAEAGVPALFHSGHSGIGTGLPGGGGIGSSTRTRCASMTWPRFPELQIVLAHSSFPWQDEAISIACTRPKV